MCNTCGHRVDDGGVNPVYPKLDLRYLMDLSVKLALMLLSGDWPFWGHPFHASSRLTSWVYLRLNPG